MSARIREHSGDRHGRYPFGMALNLRLTDEQDQRLTQLAERNGRSKQSMVLALIDAEWQRASAQYVAESMLDSIVERRADLMERLKDA